MVSVIMGVYNSDDNKLRRAVYSILNQTYSDFEFVICDDGSHNDTYSLLKEIESTDNRIVLIKNPCNMGLAFTLNRCIEMSCGSLLVRQDDDDYSSQDRLEKLVNCHNANKSYDIISSDIALTNDNGVWGERIYPTTPQAKDFLFCLPFMHGAVAFTRRSVDMVGRYCVSEKTQRTEDIELFMRMYSAGLRGITIHEKLYFYTEDAFSVSRRKYKHKVDEAWIKYHGFKQLGLLPRGILYVIKPLIVGLIPTVALEWMKDKHYKRRIV